MKIRVASAAKIIIVARLRSFVLVTARWYVVTAKQGTCHHFLGIQSPDYHRIAILVTAVTRKKQFFLSMFFIFWQEIQQNLDKNHAEWRNSRLFFMFLPPNLLFDTSKEVIRYK